MRRYPGFLDKPGAWRTAALSPEGWDDLYSPTDGEVYKRVKLLDDEQEWALKEAIRRHIGPAHELLLAAFRANFHGEIPNAYVHSDGEGWGRWALVLSLVDRPVESGTAAWKHKASGRTKLHGYEFEAVPVLARDWNDIDAFEQIDYAPLEWNTATVYPTAMLHSRWPLEGFGSSLEDGRLVLVAFFT